MSKLTVAELLKRKEDVKGRRKSTATLYVDSLSAEIEITELSPDILGEAMEQSEGNDDYCLLYGVTEPKLLDPELQAAYAPTQPTEVVRMIFRPGEVQAIAAEILKLSGYGSNAVKVVEAKVKN
ncbi:hypothetical protein ACFFSY_13810 [Paenibacillus aurantiacus]|uniref:Phage portal protein n=1 Tax=Paenibacillus aurantiacus TaxID=1936118 RepID=A0ABV5KP48_9BACL